MSAPATTEATVTATTEEERVVFIPFAELHDSPDNPRKSYGGLEKLTADIKAQGRILQPLRVRPRQPNPLRDDIVEGYEIIFGHCRKRGGIDAGMPGAPCIVTEATDAEVRHMQMSENLSRNDMHPIEEAEGYRTLMEKDGLTAKDIATRYGKSLSDIYGRLKLLEACPTVREACLKGEVLPTVALLIARLRTAKLQEKALGYIKGKYLDLTDGGKRSFRDIQTLLNEHFALDLDKAFFDPADATLLPEAGTCTDCPRRSGNAPEFADVAHGEKPNKWSPLKLGPNVCTDPDCHALKRTAHLKREAAALQADGKTVVTGNAARAAVGQDGQVKGAYIAVKDVRAELKAVKGEKPKKVLIQDPRTGEVSEAYKRTELQAVGVAAAADKPTRSAQQQQDREHQERMQEKAKQLTQQRTELLIAVRTAMADQPLGELDARLMASALWHQVTWQAKEVLVQIWGEKSEDDLEQRIAAMTLPQALQLARDCVLSEGIVVAPHWAHWPEPCEALDAAAKQYNVDKPAAKKPATKKAGKQQQDVLADATAAKPAKPGAVMYRDAATGQTWSGRGLQPKWVKDALTNGRTLDELRMGAAA